MPRLEPVNRWLARLQYISKEFQFTDGEIIEIRDEEGRLHAVNEPAYKCKTSVSFWQEGRRHGIEVDKWGSIYYYYRDVRVPRKFILSPEEITFEEVMGHPNTEVRAVGCEIYGFQRMLDEGHMTVLDTDDATGNLLMHADIRGEEPLALISVWDGTPDQDTGKREQYFLKVPPDIRSVKRAVAWTFYMDEGEYEPAVET